MGWVSGSVWGYHDGSLLLLGLLGKAFLWPSPLSQTHLLNISEKHFFCWVSSVTKSLTHLDGIWLRTLTNYYVTRAEQFPISPRLGWKLCSHCPLTSSSFSRKMELSWKIHLLPAPGDPASSPASPQPPQTDAAFTSWGSHCSLIVQEHLQTQTPGGLGCIH